VPFDRPTLSALAARVRADLRGRLSIAGPLVRRAMADVVSTVWAGAVHMLHGHLEWVAKQLFYDTSERDYLLSQAAMYGITPTPASFASGNATATGVDGSDIPEGTIIVLEAGVTYRVTTLATIAGGTATLALEAVLAGDEANAEEGATLSFESPVAGVDAEVTVAAGGISGGFDEESTEGVRDRLMLRLREPPMGGADQDYEAWALAVAGVTRAWVYPTELGLGTVVVRFVLDDEEDIFPDGAAVAAVQAALDAERPITAEVTAMAPTPLELDITLSVEPDTAEVRAAVEAEIADLLRREGEPGDGEGRGTILLSRLLTTIGISEGIEDFSLAIPAADVVPDVGELVVLGTVTFT
jgi:uncharacterized phage protein gp47/JayE